jgi:hypothetical protein
MKGYKGRDIHVTRGQLVLAVLALGLFAVPIVIGLASALR